MGRGRTLLAVAAAMSIAAIAAPAAWADVTVTQTDTPDPVDQGGTVALETTIANTGGPETDVRAHVRMSRPGTQSPVDNTYLDFTTSQGTCTPSGAGFDCAFGDVPAGGVVSLNASVQANESFAQSVSVFKCTVPTNCEFETPLGQGASISQVNYPTEFSGSNKIKFKGVPATCTNSDFKLKAKVKAKKVTRTYAYLKGPKSEFGTPLPVSGVKGRIAKSKKAKLKVKIEAGAFDPGFYELKVAAKRKGGQLKRTATFQVCGPSFGT
jgi:hypothetical protein